MYVNSKEKKTKILNSHFLVSFCALWWASKPSDKLFKELIATSSTFGRQPNHCTHVESDGVHIPSGGFTILPGQAGWPRAAPQTNSPIQNDDDNWVWFILPQPLLPVINPLDILFPFCDDGNVVVVVDVAEAVGEFVGDSIVIYQKNFIDSDFYFLQILLMNIW